MDVVLAEHASLVGVPDRIADNLDVGLGSVVFSARAQEHLCTKLENDGFQVPADRVLLPADFGIVCHHQFHPWPALALGRETFTSFNCALLLNAL